MKISIILGHQHEGSFNHALAELARSIAEKNGHTARYHDLYAEGFNPILPHAEIGGAVEDAVRDPLVRQHLEEIVEAEGIVIVHPNWWATPPAILKGWIDRVLRQGVAYRFVDGAPVGLLKAQRALVFTTSNTPADVEKKWFGDPLENFWTTCVLSYCGAQQVERTNYSSVIMSSPEERAGWLEDARQRLETAFPA